MAKGLSQILWLIISASVLMMAALSMIFIVQSGLGDTGDKSNEQACLSTIQTKCSIQGESSSINVPSSCIVDDDGDGSGDKVIERATVLYKAPPDDTIRPQGQIDCSSGN